MKKVTFVGVDIEKVIKDQKIREDLLDGLETDFDDDAEYTKILIDYSMDSGVMPYAVASHGDPYEWVFQNLKVSRV